MKYILGGSIAILRRGLLGVVRGGGGILYLCVIELVLVMDLDLDLDGSMGVWSRIGGMGRGGGWIDRW